MSNSTTRLFGCLLLFCVLVNARSAAAIEPDDPQVQEAIKKGIAFLEEASEGDLGKRSLMGLTFAKHGYKKDHEFIAETIRQLEAQTRNGWESVRLQIYHTSVAIMFLVAVDPYEYKPQIEVLVESLHNRIKEHGAWGYPENHSSHGETCDTSMTQYAVLSLWEAQVQADVPTPPEVWDSVAEWFVRTQDVTGGFGYQGEPSPDLGERIRQKAVRHSMSVAGAGSLYIVKDQLGLSDLKKPEGDNTPSVLRLYETEEERKARIKTKLDPKLIERATSAATRWMDLKYTVSEPEGWLYYYMYALERYESLKFADRFGTSVREDTPTWYHKGSYFLVKEQAEDGTWEDKGGKNVDTCFALLFLMRSTKKSLEKAGRREFPAGVLAGGRGLPGTTGVRVRDGSVVLRPLSGRLSRSLDVLVDAEKMMSRDEQYQQALEKLADAAREGKRDELTEHATGLGKVALVGHTKPRVLAIQAIERSRNLDQVPLLIHLLHEQNTEVLRAARNALRTISRRFEGYGLTLQPTTEERKAAIQKWEGWYRSIRPDVDLRAFDPDEYIKVAGN